MRFMIIRKADPDTEAEKPPAPGLFDAMMAYNDELIKAGVMVDGMGLMPSSYGARIEFEDGKPNITDGPFTEVRELIAGFTLIEVGSKEEAIEWVKRWPVEDGGGNVRLELRQVLTIDDFGDAVNDGQRAHYDEQVKAVQELHDNG